MYTRRTSFDDSGDLHDYRASSKFSDLTRLDHKPYDVGAKYRDPLDPPTKSSYTRSYLADYETRFRASDHQIPVDIDRRSRRSDEKLFTDDIGSKKYDRDFRSRLSDYDRRSRRSEERLSEPSEPYGSSRYRRTQLTDELTMDRSNALLGYMSSRSGRPRSGSIGNGSLRGEEPTSWRGREPRREPYGHSDREDSYPRSRSREGSLGRSLADASPRTMADYSGFLMEEIARTKSDNQWLMREIDSTRRDNYLLRTRYASEDDYGGDDDRLHHDAEPDSYRRNSPGRSARMAEPLRTQPEHPPPPSHQPPPPPPPQPPSPSASQQSGVSPKHSSRLWQPASAPGPATTFAPPPQPRDAPWQQQHQPQPQLQHQQQQQLPQTTDPPLPTVQYRHPQRGPTQQQQQQQYQQQQQQQLQQQQQQQQQELQYQQQHQQQQLQYQQQQQQRQQQQQQQYQQQQQREQQQHEVSSQEDAMVQRLDQNPVMHSHVAAGTHGSRESYHFIVQEERRQPSSVPSPSNSAPAASTTTPPKLGHSRGAPSATRFSDTCTLEHEASVLAGLLDDDTVTERSDISLERRVREQLLKEEEMEKSAEKKQASQAAKEREKATAEAEEKRRMAQAKAVTQLVSLIRSANQRRGDMVICYVDGTQAHKGEYLEHLTKALSAVRAAVSAQQLKAAQRVQPKTPPPNAASTAEEVEAYNKESLEVFYKGWQGLSSSARSSPKNVGRGRR